MRNSSAFAPRSRSRWSRVLLLAALFAVLAVAMTPALHAADSQQPPANAAEFLATLSAAPAASTPALQAPAPTFLSGCTSNSQCPTGQLCCLACGYDGCETRACFQPVKGRCPLFV
jgi:hypothetical protein